MFNSPGLQWGELICKRYVCISISCSAVSISMPVLRARQGWPDPCTWLCTTVWVWWPPLWLPPPPTSSELGESLLPLPWKRTDDLTFKKKCFSKRNFRNTLNMVKFLTNFKKFTTPLTSYEWCGGSQLGSAGLKEHYPIKEEDIWTNNIIIWDGYRGTKGRWRRCPIKKKWKEKPERWNGKEWRRWETCEPAKIATGENVVLFMIRSVVDKDTGSKTR